MAIDIQDYINRSAPLPPGTWTATTPLTVPGGCVLQGANTLFSYEGGGTRLEFPFSAGQAADPPFITAMNGSVVRNLTIGLPGGADYHTPYPWCIHTNGPDALVEHVCLDKVWQGLWLTSRCRANDIMVQPLLTGIQVDASWDQVVVENCNADIFDPTPPGIDAFMAANATCFAFLKADLFRGNNLVASSTKIGFLFDQSPSGLGYGHLTNFSVDTCTVGVQLNAIAFPGVSLGNFDIIGCPKAVVTGPNFGDGRGKALFANGCFSGGASLDAVIAHTGGQLTLTGCAFDAYNGYGVLAGGGTLNVSGCRFTGSTNGQHVCLQSGTQAAVVVNNLDAEGQKFHVANAIGTKAMIANNWP